MASQSTKKAIQQIDLPRIWPVACHTDHIGPGSTFVAIKGMQYDGLEYIAKAIKKGASTIVVDQNAQLSVELQQLLDEKNITVERVANTRKALAQLSAQAYDYPARKLTIIGVTGTKGKTTTAYLVHHGLRSAGKRAALLSTVENKIDDQLFINGLTTPQPDYLHMFMHVCVQQGITHLVMEAAAQAFSLYRLSGIQFDVGVFTNFGHEHLEFYADLDEYFKAKCQLIKHLKTNAPLILNTDDVQCAKLVDQYHHIITFQLKQLEALAFVPKILFVYHAQLIEASQLMGIFNAYNALAALRALEYLGISLHQCAFAFKSFAGIKGRLQRHALPNGAVCYVDYAHTPDSYEQVLSLLHKLTHKLIVVFGCGGGRDRSKRSLMGSIACRYADQIVLTSDNPRHEDAQTIVHDIMAGIDTRQKVHIELDRARAIEHAYALSSKGAIIAVLGKGPDEFQCIGTKRYFFSDTQIVNSLEGTL